MPQPSLHATAAGQPSSSITPSSNGESVYASLLAVSRRFHQLHDIDALARDLPSVTKTFVWPTLTPEERSQVRRELFDSYREIVGLYEQRSQEREALAQSVRALERILTELG